MIEIDDLDMFFVHLDFAKKCQMEFEFMKSFLEEFKRGENIRMSILYANQEWDL